MHIVLLLILCTRLSAIVCFVVCKTMLPYRSLVIGLCSFIYVTCMCLGCPLPVQLPPVHTLDPAIIAKQHLVSEREDKD